ncbi:hypothetical protein ACP275_05G062800 [Erythranthe tilingii]
MASLNDGEHHKQKSLDQEVREMISTLTNRLGSIQRSSHPKSSSSGGSGPHDDEDDDGDRGVRIITLAGTNLGATMRGGETDENGTGPDKQGPARPGQEEDEEDFATYVNSNFQAINNSIMFGGTYTTNDPGVHLDISDYYHRQKDDDVINKTNGKKVRKNNYNKRGGSISNKTDDRLTGHSDKSTSDDEKKP